MLAAYDQLWQVVKLPALRKFAVILLTFRWGYFMQAEQQELVHRVAAGLSSMSGLPSCPESFAVAESSRCEGRPFARVLEGMGMLVAAHLGCWVLKPVMVLSTANLRQLRHCNMPIVSWTTFS